MVRYWKVFWLSFLILFTIFIAIYAILLALFDWEKVGPAGGLVVGWIAGLGCQAIALVIASRVDWRK